jgi:proteasome lid subunit RPN8/RPN11
MPGVNVAEDPTAEIELSSAWIADILTGNTSAGPGPQIAAFFHSHPGGEDKPSPLDMGSFPWYYATLGLIYYGDPEKMAAYNNDNFWYVPVGPGVLVEVE